MKNLFKGKIATVGIIIATLILAGVAVFTAVRLYQLRQEAVAPTAPTSKPKAQEVPKACTSLAFVLGETPTPTPSGSGTPTPSGTPTETPTATPTSSGTPNTCNGTCGSNANCDSGLFCYEGYCRNTSCPAETDCSCPLTSTSTSTPGSTTTASVPTQASLPDAGTSLPTIFGIGLGTILLIGAILLAL